MSFSDMLESLKQGAYAWREGWNGKNMYIYRKQFEGYEPCIVMHTVDGKEQPGWLASQYDLLAVDWSYSWGKPTI